MPKKFSSYQQYRKTLGQHINWQDKKQGTQQQQDARAQISSARPAANRRSSGEFSGSNTHDGAASARPPVNEWANSFGLRHHPAANAMNLFEANNQMSLCLRFQFHRRHTR